jgi:hypothetical protein
MRDIRSDLQERAKLIEGQISSAYTHFEKVIEQLQSEHDARVAEFKSELAVIGKVMEAEHRRMGNPPPAVAPLKLSLADFVVRRLNEIGAMSSDDLCALAIEEGYLPDLQSAGKALSATLTDLVRQERIRELPDGTFAPITLSEVIRLRRVI